MRAKLDRSRTGAARGVDARHGQDRIEHAVSRAGTLVYAFFKLAGAFRLSHYGSIMIGAMPAAGAAASDECTHHAERTAPLIGPAGEHSNSGIRSFYHAIAALAWFFHPLLFMATTTSVVLILARRDFFSRSLRLIAGNGRV